MTYNAEILLGKITRLHGYQGFVSVKLEKSFIGNIPEMKSVFLIVEGIPVPFLISGIEYPGAETIRFAFMGYESQEKIAEFVGCEVYLTEKNMPGPGFGREKGDITGFSVNGDDGKIIGKVKGLIENPGQLLAEVIDKEGDTILIPLHADLILKTDFRKRLLVVKLPEGLTEINK